MRKRFPLFLFTCLAFGYAFLYVPIFILMIYSFNVSKLVTVWAGFSTKWYEALLKDQGLLDAAWVSLKIAFLTACGALILGTVAGFVMARFKGFRGKTVFASMITAPLVMPEVITGLSLLLLFVSMDQLMGWPSGRGITTIWIAHVTFSSSFVAIIVSARLREMDISLEEAAMDLGAPPWKVFCVITLPIISPALLAGWLLSFTLSMDDLVIASFVSGPGSTTLPMKVFSSVRLGISPKINAIATILVLAVTLGIVIYGWLLFRMDKKRQWEVASGQNDSATKKIALENR